MIQCFSKSSFNNEKYAIAENSTSRNPLKFNQNPFKNDCNDKNKI